MGGGCAGGAAVVLGLVSVFFTVQVVSTTLDYALTSDQFVLF